jgi:hypothetical protein
VSTGFTTAWFAFFFTRFARAEDQKMIEDQKDLGKGKKKILFLQGDPGQSTGGIPWKGALKV